jgi:hypothetical protein
MTTKTARIDGNALIRALRYSPAHFHKLRGELIKGGATDSDLAHAMADATEMVESIGSRSAKVPKPKYGKK